MDLKEVKESEAQVLDEEMDQDAVDELFEDLASTSD
jgi:hypothetical protein